MDFPVLLLWADEDAAHPLAIAEEALDLFPDAQLRVLPRTGFLIAYDDPVGVARELVVVLRVRQIATVRGDVRAGPAPDVFDRASDGDPR